MHFQQQGMAGGYQNYPGAQAPTIKTSAQCGLPAEDARQ